MNKILLGAALLFAALTGTHRAKAQMPYLVNTTTQAYQPLSGATSVNNNNVWNENDQFSIPLGFTFNWAGTPITNLSLGFSGLLTPSATGTNSVFVYLSAGLHDRGETAGISRSPIRYATVGNAGSRIFKLEFLNAGFAEEEVEYGTNNDSLNMQVWLYEATGQVEYHYGSAQISHFSKYFGAHLFAGYVRNMNLTTYTFSKGYVLTGNPAAPGLDSVNAYTETVGLTSYPAAGTVYRFTPKGSSTGIDHHAATALARLYPTPCTSALNLEHSSPAAIDYWIIDQQGRVAGNGKALPGKTTIPVSQLPAGAYFLRMIDAERAWDAQPFTKL